MTWRLRTGCVSWSWRDGEPSNVEVVARPRHDECARRPPLQAGSPRCACSVRLPLEYSACAGSFPLNRSHFPLTIFPAMRTELCAISLAVCSGSLTGTRVTKHIPIEATTHLIGGEVTDASTSNRSALIFPSGTSTSQSTTEKNLHPLGKVTLDGWRFLTT